MNDLVLTLSIRWLPAVDAFAASCVSREWQAALTFNRDNGELWKQVSKNSYPQATSAIQEAIDFRRLALGLYQSDYGEPPPVTFTPTLSPDDLFAVIELYREPGASGDDTGPRKKRRQVIEASFVCPVTLNGIEMTNDDSNQIFTGENPYSESIRDSDQFRVWRKYEGCGGESYEDSPPYQFAAFRVLGRSFSRGGGGRRLDESLGIRTTLFRKDNMKSVCVLNEEQWNKDWHKDFEDDKLKVEYLGSKLHLDVNDAGRKAQAMLCSKYHQASVGMTADLSVEAILPSPGSKEEPYWLVNCREACQRGQWYRPSRQDAETLSSLRHFEFRVKVSIDISPANRIQDVNVEDEFRSKEDMMVALEGLCWQ